MGQSPPTAPGLPGRETGAVAPQGKRAVASRNAVFSMQMSFHFGVPSGSRWPRSPGKYDVSPRRGQRPARPRAAWRSLVGLGYPSSATAGPGPRPAQPAIQGAAWRTRRQDRGRPRAVFLGTGDLVSRRPSPLSSRARRHDLLSHHDCNGGGAIAAG